MVATNTSLTDHVCVVRYDSMALAIYREVASHLQSLQGVQVSLEPNPAQTFRYEDSQVGSLIIVYPAAVSWDQLKPILDHYGPWQVRADAV